MRCLRRADMVIVEMEFCGEGDESGEEKKKKKIRKLGKENQRL